MEKSGELSVRLPPSLFLQDQHKSSVVFTPFCLPLHPFPILLSTAPLSLCIIYCFFCYATPQMTSSPSYVHPYLYHILSKALFSYFSTSVPSVVAVRHQLSDKWLWWWRLIHLLKHILKWLRPFKLHTQLIRLTGWSMEVESPLVPCRARELGLFFTPHYFEPGSMSSWFVLVYFFMRFYHNRILT